MTLTEKDGRRYLVNMSLDPNGLCYFFPESRTRQEATADEMDQALGKLQEDWKKFLSDPLPQTVKWICMKRSLREAISWTMES